MENAIEKFERRRRIVQLLEALNALIGDDFEFTVRLKRQYTNDRERRPTCLTPAMLPTDVRYFEEAR